MFGANNSLAMLRDIATSKGAYFQLELDLETPEWFFIRPEFLTSVPEELSFYNARGVKGGVYTTKDHPSFARLREHLGSKGLIRIERSWSNGDRVLKPFYLNNILLVEHETFGCAAAMKHPFGAEKAYNKGEIIPLVKNYKEGANLAEWEW